MTSHQVLFCPFCGESFEGRATCPAHELVLVPFDRAPAFPDAERDDDDVLAGEAHDALDDARALSPWEPRLGRGPVALAAILLALAPLLGLARVGGETLRTHEVAMRFPSLWTWPLVSFCAFYLLSRRRTPAALRGLRVVVPWLGLVALLTLVLAGVRLGAAIFEAPAAYVVALASALLLAAGARLGRQ
ncbi:MAG: hypothetical protein ABW252_01810 [Polyangiales bacterium]